MDSNTSRIILEAAGTIALAPVSLVSLLRQVQYDGPETSTGPGQERSPKKKDEPARQDLDLTSKLHQAETYLQQEEKNGISDPQLKSESLMKDETVKRYIVNGECVQRTSAYPTIDKSLIKCGWIESARQIYRSQVRLSIFRGAPLMLIRLSASCIFQGILTMAMRLLVKVVFGGPSDGLLASLLGCFVPAFMSRILMVPLEYLLVRRLAQSPHVAEQEGSGLLADLKHVYGVWLCPAHAARPMNINFHWKLSAGLCALSAFSKTGWLLLGQLMRMSTPWSLVLASGIGLAMAFISFPLSNVRARYYLEPRLSSVAAVSTGKNLSSSYPLQPFVTCVDTHVTATRRLYPDNVIAALQRIGKEEGWLKLWSGTGINTYYHWSLVLVHRLQGLCKSFSSTTKPVLVPPNPQ